MSSILPSHITLYIPEKELPPVEESLHALGLRVVQKLSSPDEFDISLHSKERKHCFIVHPDLEIDKLHKQLIDSELEIRWSLFTPLGYSLDTIKKTFQAHPFLKGIISGENTSLLRSGLRQNTHIFPSNELPPLIANCLFFKDFTDEEKERLLKSTSAYGFTAGETIIDPEDPTDFFFVILQGKAEIMLFDNPDHPTIIPIGDGQPIGEMSVIDKAPRSGVCLSVDETVVLKISAQVLNLPNCHIPKKIAFRLAQVLAQRLRNTNTILLETLDKACQQATPKAIPKIKSKPKEKEEVAPKATPKIKKKDSKKKAAPKKEEEEEDEEEKIPNPFATPTGEADELLEDIKSQEEYDVLKRKIQLRTDFILSKIPNSVIDAINNKLFGYLTGSKLAKVNPHDLWDEEWFSGGSPHLLRALHMVVCCRNGDELFDKAFLQLQFSQRVVGLLQRGCAGTFLGSEDAIERYAQGKNLAKAAQLDFEIPIDRIWEGNDCIEFLTHTSKDVRPDTLFYVFDEEDGKVTAQIRKAFPTHQIITVVSGLPFNKEDPLSIFNGPEEKLAEQNALPLKAAFKNKGFYQGETFFLADFAPLFEQYPALKGKSGSFFATMAILAFLGPDYSGLIWGSKGGAEGAVRAARAKFGIKGAQSAQDLADAVNWADQ